MKIILETSLENFEFWSGAKDTAEEIRNNGGDWKAVENEIEEKYPEGITDTQLNDLFWFESELILDIAGVEEEEEEEEYKRPEDCETFNEFCDQFATCSICPWKGKECYDYFKQLKEGGNNG